eukprot:3952059-Pleurochrysis_carterae.AAC.2
MWCSSSGVPPVSVYLDSIQKQHSQAKPWQLIKVCIAAVLLLDSDIANTGEIMSIVKGGRAHEDGLMRVSDVILAVDNTPFVDGDLGRLLRRHAPPWDFTVLRDDPALVTQLRSLDLPQEATYRLLKAGTLGCVFFARHVLVRVLSEKLMPVRLLACPLIT